MTGWPWPLDAVQGFFENLWNHIISAAEYAVSFVWQWIQDAVGNLWKSISTWAAGLWNGIVSAFGSLYQSIVDIAGMIWTGIVNTVSNLWTSLVNAFWDLWAAVGEAFNSLWSNLVRAFWDLWIAVGSHIDNLWLNLVDSFWNLWIAVKEKADLWGFRLQEFIGESVGGLVTMFDGAVGSIGDAFGLALGGFTDLFIGGLTTFFLGALGETTASLTSSLTNLKAAGALIHGSPPRTAIPVTPLVAKNFLEPYADKGFTDFLTAEAMIVAVEALTAGQVDVGAAEFMNNPAARAYASIVQKIMESEFLVGIMPAYEQFWLRDYRPNLPSISEARQMVWRGVINKGAHAEVVARKGYGQPFVDGYYELLKALPSSADLVRMVVREAFVPEMVIEAPAVFAAEMTKQGYSKEWSDRYWTAHFEPIALTQAYWNLWRGLWTKEKFLHALHIADIHPMWREDIYNVAFRAPGLRELGYGYDVNVYSLEEITKYRRYAGLSLEDAEKSAVAMVAYRTAAEREALRREALADFVTGLDTESELRVKLTAIETRPEIIDLWVARAVYRTDRDMKLDLVKVAKDLFVKGLLTEVELRSELSGLGVVAERIEIHVAEATTRRASRVKAVEAEKKRSLTEAKIAKAWELGLIGDSGYVSRLIDRDYTEEDAQLMLDIIRTPLPITDEEIERRRKSIEAKINRVRRRYDLMILRLDAQLGLIADEIEAAGATQKEVLDVYDTELTFLRSEAAVAAPEKVAALEKRIALITERREVAVARYQERVVKLKDNLAAAADRKTELLKMRDEEISDLESELRAIGAVAA